MGLCASCRPALHRSHACSSFIHTSWIITARSSLLSPKLQMLSCHTLRPRWQACFQRNRFDDAAQQYHCGCQQGRTGKGRSRERGLSSLGAGLASLAPIRVLTDCGGVVGPFKSATIEVQVSTEIKLDSAWSDTGHSTGEEYTASPLRVIIYPPPHQTRPPILMTVETNTTALEIANKTAILFCMSPTCVDAHYLYFGTSTPQQVLSRRSECEITE